MPKARKRQRRQITGCVTKVAYSDRETADREVQRLWDEKGDRTHAYACLYCGAYHVGSDLTTKGHRRAARQAWRTKHR